MRIDHRLLSWGVFFIAVGSIPLAVRAGAIDSAVFAEAWRLWPLALVGVGVGILLRGSRVALLGGLIVGLTFGIAGGGILAGASFDLGAIACGSRVASGSTFARTGTFGTTATVGLRMRCGDLNVTTAPGATWSVTGVSPQGREPDINGESDQLSMDSRVDGTFLPGFGGDRDRWDVTLPQGSMLDLTATVNAGDGRLDLGSARLGTVDLTVNAADAHLDLEGATVSDMRITVNAGDVRIVLPDASLTGSFTVNAGSIRFCTTADAGLRISTTENFAASYDFTGSGLLKDGPTWTSPNFATAAVRIDLSATANAGDIALNPKDGCR